MKVLFINNRDSFVYILVDYVAQLGSEVVVVDNSIKPREVKDIRPDKIVISPGPGHPRKSTGNVIPIIQSYSEVPMLGVCLGHQSIAEAFKGRVERAPVGPRHGKISLIHHDGRTIFRGLPNPLEAVRYHSLTILPASLPDALELSARADDGTIMGIRHKTYPLEGVQFHPESVLTEDGIRIIKNFLEL